MYKVIDIGATVPSTGEVRVTLIRDGDFIKTASTEIQEFWDSMKRRPGFAYLWVIGVSAMEYYGCNNNGDAFSEEDLINHHADFVSNAHVFMHHVNKDPAKSIGKPVYSWYNQDMHRVELILAIKKDAPGAAQVLQKLTKGEQLFVSMGCSVAYDVCSICGNKSPTRAHYCDHLRYNMKKILPDGRQVYALNPNPKFFDISLVNKPADPTAFALDKVASVSGNAAHPWDGSEISSAELGEQAEDLSIKTATLRKLSDIIKEVEGTVADADNISPEIKVVRSLRDQGFQNFDYPDFDHMVLKHHRISPAGLMMGLAHCGSHLSLGDALYMACKHFLGDQLCPQLEDRVLDILPGCLNILSDDPSEMSGLAHEIMSDYGGELDTPKRIRVTISIIRPVAQKRIAFMDRMVPLSLEKYAKDVFNNPIGNMFLTEANSTGSNFAPVALPDGSKTTRYHLAMASAHSDGSLTSLIGMAGLGAATILGLAAMLTQRKNPGSTAGAIIAGLAGSKLADAFFERNSLKRQGLDVDTLADGTQRSALVFNQCWKEPVFEKTSALFSVLPSSRLGVFLGMGLPSAFALDYVIQRWKAKNNPYGYDPTSLRNRIGEFSKEHLLPASLGAGMITAAIGSKLGLGPKLKLGKVQIAI